MHHVNPKATLAEAYESIKTYFDYDAFYFNDWTSTTLNGVRRENPDKTLEEAVELLVEKLDLCQRALAPHFNGRASLNTAIVSACSKSPEMRETIMEVGPSTSFETLVTGLRRRAAFLQWEAVDRQESRSRPQRVVGKCFICRKKNCRSCNHSEEDRREARELLDRHQHIPDKAFRAFLIDYENSPIISR
ncbi:hypothetical protein O181_025965 [Austropuccinia psidii MF-1]|uniref:Uncharacterized protein n=1 Tax=Austropuccinia psidii MF-1 TaxID=1389203 RepID=A0A9Q3H1Q3_9BASI|nr:hypothetical protein [Austropuccinia psidii MF-1]